MNENKVLNSLLDECTAYIRYDQDINPAHVKDMLRKAYDAGREGVDVLNGEYTGTKEHDKDVDVYED